MPRRSPFCIVLSPQEEETLQKTTRKYASPHRDVVRAKVILLAAQGQSNTEIAKRVGMSRKIVCRWRKRFYEERLEGIKERRRSGRPPRFSPLASV